MENKNRNVKPPSPFFFIIGNPRSGTSLLRLMLTCNRQICIPPEGGFATYLHWSYRNFDGSRDQVEAFVSELLKVSKMEYWNIEANSLIKYINEKGINKYSELCLAVYKWYSLNNGYGTSSVLGDKNNYYLNRIDKLAKLFPDSKFIHIVRDGRDVACSYRKLRSVEGKYAPDLPTSINHIAKEWRDNLNKINNSFSKIEKSRTLEVRYEDLVLQPKEELSRVCEYLGVDFDEMMLQYYRINEKKGLEPTDFDEWKNLNKQKLTASRIKIWKEGMFDEDIYHFQRIAGNQLSQYKYAILNFSISEKIKYRFWL